MYHPILEEVERLFTEVQKDLDDIKAILEELIKELNDNFGRKE